MRIENRMRSSYGEKSVRKSGRKKTAVFWSVDGTGCLAGGSDKI